MVVPFLFIHICTSESQSHVMHTLAFERNFHAIYLLLRGNSTSYIHLGSILVPSWHGYIFWKASYATYPPIYIFWNTLFTIIHFARYFYAIYSHTLQHIFMPYIFTHISTHHWKASPTSLRCKNTNHGAAYTLTNKSLFSCFFFLHSKPKFKTLGISHASLHWNLKA